jgi:hypothetical protein
LKLLEDYKHPHKPDGPDGSDSSDGFSKTHTTSKENHNIEISNNSQNPTNIFEGNLDRLVNNTTEKIENPSTIPIKSSEPSEPSVNNATGIMSTIFRFGHSDIFGCRNCKQKGDRWHMETHDCNGKR